jgi:hypothetical protein
MFSSCKKTTNDSIELLQWKFATGDDKSWADPNYQDEGWANISVKKSWELAGFDHDGYAWYRTTFILPEELKTNAAFKDSLQIFLGKIDDSDETYLNGILIGKNGTLASEADTIHFEKYAVWNITRNYILPANSPLLRWGEKNTIAIRVFDRGGGGGLYSGTPSVSMRDIKNYLVMDHSAKAVAMSADSTVNTTLVLNNTSEKYEFSGKLLITITDDTNNKTLSDKRFSFNLKPGTNAEFEYKLPQLSDNRYTVNYKVEEVNNNYTYQENRQLPYILTPRTSDFPRINGAKVTAARPGKPFLFKISASGLKPMKYKAEYLPLGLCLDAQTGIISGSVQTAGEYNVKLVATNAKGEVASNLKIMIGDKLSLTPPMGWNSWNCWGLSIDENKMKSAIDELVTKGLIDHGWTYVNIGDGWTAAKRAGNGNIVNNEKFGNIKALADYAHANGLKLGIYSSPGPLTCGNYLGSYNSEYQDVKTFSNWGIDFLKYDWCSYNEICRNANNVDELKKPYLLMNEALKTSNRDIVYSISQYGMGNVCQWGESAGAQMWRVTGDITDSWESMSGIGFFLDNAAPFTKPGSWMDPDMLVVGYIGWGTRLRYTQLTADEQYTHVSLWAMLSAPLFIGCDLSRLDDFTLNLLTNDEVIDIDQDLLGLPAKCVVRNADYQIYTKRLEDGSKAVGLFNLSAGELNMKCNWRDLQVVGNQLIRDVWRQKDLGIFENSYETKVPAHGVVLLKFSNK